MTADEMAEFMRELGIAFKRHGNLKFANSCFEVERELSRYAGVEAALREIGEVTNEHNVAAIVAASLAASKGSKESHQ